MPEIYDSSSVLNIIYLLPTEQRCHNVSPLSTIAECITVEPVLSDLLLIKYSVLQTSFPSPRFIAPCCFMQKYHFCCMNQTKSYSSNLFM